MIEKIQESIDQLMWRYAVKEYDATQKLSEEQVHLIKEALRLSPSSFGLQAWRFVHVKTPEVREQLKEIAYGQSQVTDASDVFVLTVRTSLREADIDAYMNNMASARGIEVESLAGFRAMISGLKDSKSPADLAVWLRNQAYIALGVALAVAAEHGIDATPMEGFDSAKTDELLGLTELGLTSVLLMPVGFRSSEDPMQNYAKARFSEEEVFIVK